MVIAYFLYKKTRLWDLVNVLNILYGGAIDKHGMALNKIYMHTNTCILTYPFLEKKNTVTGLKKKFQSTFLWTFNLFRCLCAQYSISQYF